MIHRVYSNLASFKEIEFHSGMNILLADKSSGATDRQTRNSSGKSSLIELFHFLSGADCPPDSIFRTPVLRPYEFGLEFDLKGERTAVARCGEKPSDVVVAAGNTSTWPIPAVRKRDGRVVISNTKWKSVLGSLMFDLAVEEDAPKFGPTFRSLFSYFARRQGSGGFIAPERNAGQQQLGDSQVAVTTLLGLDWTITQKWQFVRERERTLRELKKAAEEGAFGAILGTSAKLRTQLTLAEERTRRLRTAVDTFQVLDEYREFEKEASDITHQLAGLSDENTLDRELVLDLKASITEEAPPVSTDLERLYKEVGIVLPSSAVRRFADVLEFHDTVVRNRRNYLQSEIDDAERRIRDRERQMATLTGRRAHILGILKSHGALDQLTKLQSELSSLEAQTEAIRQQFNAAEQLEGQKTELEFERAQLLVRLQQDYHEEANTLRQAIVAFEDISSSLYEKAGSLTVSPSFNGPQFEIKIEGSRSKGISNMQIFCFDMMLMQLCARRGYGPGFLVHDSHLFDGVDERQVATALQVGAELSARLGFQYIVTMNSDAIPTSLPSDFQFDEYVLPIRLTDATDDGGLFGIRF